MAHPFLRSFAFAGKGILYTFKEGRNFKVQLGFAAAALGLCALLSVSPTEWIVVILCIATVLGSECLNTAIEAAVDLSSPDIHPLAGAAKDCAAGGVLLASAASLVIGLIIFLPRLWNLFFA